MNILYGTKGLKTIFKLIKVEKGWNKYFEIVELHRMILPIREESRDLIKGLCKQYQIQDNLNAMCYAFYLLKDHYSLYNFWYRLKTSKNQPGDFTPEEYLHYKEIVSFKPLLDNYIDSMTRIVEMKIKCDSKKKGVWQADDAKSFTVVSSQTIGLLLQIIQDYFEKFEIQHPDTMDVHSNELNYYGRDLRFFATPLFQYLQDNTRLIKRECFSFISKTFSAAGHQHYFKGNSPPHKIVANWVKRYAKFQTT